MSRLRKIGRIRRGPLIGAGGRRAGALEAGLSAMVVEEDGKRFSAFHLEVGDKHGGPSGLGDLEVPEYLTRTPWAVGAR